MLTREQAIEKAAAELGKDWDERRGTFHVLIELEDDDDFVAVPGAREWLVDQNQDYASYDDTFYWLNKTSGNLRLGSQMDQIDIEKIDKTRPVEGVDVEEFESADDAE